MNREWRDGSAHGLCSQNIDSIVGYKKKSRVAPKPRAQTFLVFEFFIEHRLNIKNIRKMEREKTRSENKKPLKQLSFVNTLKLNVYLLVMERWNDVTRKENIREQGGATLKGKT